MVQARTKLRKARNWAFRKAADLVGAACAEGNTATLNWKDRTVTVNDEVAFSQQPGEKGGTFKNSFAHLALP